MPPIINDTLCSSCAWLQGVAGSSTSNSDSGTCCEMEVALQWLNVLYARECQAEAGAGTGAAEGHRSPPVAGGRSSASPSRAGSSPYETTLLQLLHGLRQALPPSSKIIVRWATNDRCNCTPVFFFGASSQVAASDLGLCLLIC